jgi:hypothetical protein
MAGDRAFFRLALIMFKSTQVCCKRIIFKVIHAFNFKKLYDQNYFVVIINCPFKPGYLVTTRLSKFDLSSQLIISYLTWMFVTCKGT